MKLKPNYRTLTFWGKVRDEIKEVIHSMQFTPNTFDNAGNETGAHVLLLYGDTGQCELQLNYGNTPKGVANTMLKHCKDLPGTYEKCED